MALNVFHRFPICKVHFEARIETRFYVAVI